jgi:putative DNA primase/helicase
MASPRKMMPGTVPEGACVRLCDGHPGSVLGIAEGIETALAASRLFEIPVWSAISSSLLAKWQPPDGVEEVVIFADNDPKFGGQAAAYHLAYRLARTLQVSVKMPPREGMDFADVLFETACSP